MWLKLKDSQEVEHSNRFQLDFPQFFPHSMPLIILFVSIIYLPPKLVSMFILICNGTSGCPRLKARLEELAYTRTIKVHLKNIRVALTMEEITI